MAKNNVAKQGKAGEPASNRRIRAPQPESGATAANTGQFAPEIIELATKAGVTPTEGNRALLERMAYEEKLANTELTFSMRELCDAVGFSVEPHEFAAQALEEIGHQIDAEASACVEEAARSAQLLSIVRRAQFAALVIRKLEDAS